jgi:hypothetical protein
MSEADDRPALAVESALSCHLPTTGLTREFSRLVLKLHGRTGLTQHEPATKVSVNLSSIHGSEAGAT